MKKTDGAHNLAEFDGADWSSGKVRGNLDNGGLVVGWNMPSGEDGEVILTAADCFNSGNRASVVLTKADAADLLTHLNDLLGNPLSYAPSAG